MMKNTIFWPLLSLLILGVTPRDSSARELARDVTTPGPTVNGTTSNNMIEGINQLTESITWLQDNMPSDKYFHGTIDNIEEDILSLPIELAEERAEMLAMLYISKDRFNETRSVLEKASNNLESQCDDMIELINNTDYSEMLLKYIAKNIVKHASLFNGVLEVALNKLIEIQDNLSELKTRAEKINWTFENKEHIFLMFDSDLKLSKQQDIAEDTFEAPAGTIIRFEILSGAVTPKTNPVIKYISVQNPKIILEGDNEGTENLPVELEKPQESISELLLKITNINEYIVNESDIITKYQISLDTSISDHEDISMEDIKYKFKSLKDSIVALKNACSSYSRGAFFEL